MSRYKYTTVVGCILDTKQNVSFIEGAPNWEEYQKWLSEGNTPDPADPVVVTAEMIKAEAGKRILVRYPQWKQANMTARMVELNKIRASVGSWTAGEQIEVDVIQSAWDWVKSVRSASDALELTLPVDYSDNNLYWPTA
jgi:hypothetical protein